MARGTNVKYRRGTKDEQQPIESLGIFGANEQISPRVRPQTQQNRSRLNHRFQFGGAETFNSKLRKNPRRVKIGTQDDKLWANM